MRLAAVTVTYNPTEDIINNIKSYSTHVGKIFIIDNSIHSLLPEIKCNTPVVIIKNNKNLGVAAALNIGIEKAQLEGFSWVLTMDQDSIFKPDMISNYFSAIKSYPSIEDVGIFGPEIIGYNETSNPGNINFAEETILITSGNLLNIKAWEKIGGFDEKLFIDEVDHDFCVRAKLSGFKIMKVKGTFLHHNLGNVIYIQKNGTLRKKTIHQPFRMYYIIRNGLYFIKKYKKVFPELCRKRKKILLVTVKNNIIYNPGRLKVIYYILLGGIHFYLNSFGKIKNK